jgi:large subunit ribosomal protein L10
MPKPEKVQAVAELKELFENANSFFVTDYQGLNVADMTDLRRDLRKSDVRYLIAKNTLLKLAVSQAGIAGIDKHLSGPTAVAFAHGDPAAAAKVINESFKKRELPRVKVFSVENELYAAEQLGRLADLPSREQLLSQLVADIESPIAAVARMINGIFQELVGTVDALADKKKAQEGS